MTKKAVIAGALLVCLLAVWIYTEKRIANELRPPEGVTNLVAFLEARPQPSKIRKFPHNGKTHIELIGKPVTSLTSLPSGPPAYVFDETGVLVDWTADRGDTPSFVRKWGSLSNATFITIEEAKQLTSPTEH